MSATRTLAHTLTELVSFTGKSFIVLEVDHLGSSSSRLAYEFGDLGPDVLEAILTTNLALIEFADSQEATTAFLELEADFPLGTITSIDATLIRPHAAPLRFAQQAGHERTTEGFGSNARA